MLASKSTQQTGGPSVAFDVGTRVRGYDVAAGLALLFLVSPQAQYLIINRWVFGGFAYALAAGALVVAHVAQRGVVGQVVRHNLVTLLLIGVFCAQAAARLVGADSDRIGAATIDALVNAYIRGPLTMVPWLLLIWTAAELGPRSLSSVKRILVIGWSVSLALAIPFLLREPGIARSTMGDLDPDGTEFARLAIYGIGNYSHYSSFGLLWGLAAVEVREMQGTWRTFGLVAVAGGLTATVLSTFTMGVTMAACSAVLLVVAWIGAKGGAARRLGRVYLGAALLTATIAVAVQFAAASPAVEFAVSKAERLVRGMGQYGLEAGDETGRGAWVVEAWNHVLDENPIVGFVDGWTRLFHRGHSSVMDTWTVFGIAGLIWVALLWRLFRTSQRAAETASRKTLYGGAFALFVGFGLLNPTWYHPVVLCTLVALTTTARSRRRDPKVAVVRVAPV